MIINHQDSVAVVDAKSEKKLRSKVFFGFAIITLISSVLFVVEGYESSLEFGRRMENIQLHENANHVAEYLDTSNEIASERISPADAVKHLHTHSPAAVILTDGEEQIFSVQDLSTEDLSQIIKRVSFLKSEHPKHAVSHNVLEHHEICDDDSCLVDYNGQEYNWMVHHSRRYGEILVIQKQNILGQASEIVIPRLVLSAVVFIWIGFWASFGVALFISKWVRKSNKAIIYANNYHQMLGIPNHQILNAKLDEIKAGEQHKNHNLLLVSVENLDILEQLYGNNVKDKILKAISDKIHTLASDLSLVGVYQDKVFYLLMLNSPIQQSIELSLKIEKCFEEMISSDNIQFAPKVIQGITHFKKRNRSNQQVISSGLYALATARDERKKSCVFSEDIKFKTEKRNLFNLDLSSALNNKEFVLHYQPKIDLSTNTITGVEALVRWIHPTKGLLYPADFIDLIETSSINKLFTANIVEMALAQSASWSRQELEIPIAINITPFDLKNKYLMRYLNTLFEDVNNTKKIEFELTEFETDIDIEYMANAFRRFGQQGIHCSIDDYGTGMCTLAYLKDIPIDTIKIDRMFIDDLRTNKASRAITESTIKLARELNCSVVAEGIEDAKTAEIVKNMGCDVGQGYYFSKPITGEEICKLALAFP